MTPKKGSRRARKAHFRQLTLDRVDWATMKNCDIARALGLSESHVSNLRRRLAPGTVRARRGRVDWESVNWLLPNCEIAEMLGVSRQLVFLARQRMGIPKHSELNADDLL